MRFYFPTGGLAILLLLLVFPPYAWNKEVSFRRISLDQGLSQSLVQCILQDRRGFMWFGTEDGLNRYDGFDFTYFRFSSSDSNSLSGNNIWCLFEDDEGQIWIGTWGNGLNRYDPVRMRFTRFQHNPADPHSISGNRVVSILQDAEGSLWVSTADGGLNCFDAQTERFVRYTASGRDADEGEMPTNELFGMLLDPDGMIWIGTYDAGLLRFNPRSGAIEQFAHDPRNRMSLPDNRVLALCRGEGRSLWVGTWGGGVASLDIDAGVFRQLLPPDGSSGRLESDIVRALHRDKGGNLWIGTLGGGVSHLDNATGHLTTYRHSPYRSSTIGDDMVVTIYEDRGDVLWFGTGRGLSSYSPHRMKFGQISNDPDAPTSLGGRSVFALSWDASDVLWVGTKSGGLSRVDMRSGTTLQYRHDPADSTSLSADYVSAILTDRDGNLWVGTWGGGLNLLRRGAKEFQRFRASASATTIPNDFISCLAEDSAGTLWVGLWSSGLVALHRNSVTIEHYVHDSNDPSSLPDDDIRCIYTDRGGQVWVGMARGGLARFDRSEEAFLPGISRPSSAESPSIAYVQAIWQDRRGRLWLGTFGDGLIEMDPETGVQRRFTEREGLPNNVVYGILEDAAGHLWISTNRGLCHFDPAGEVIRTFDRSDGLRSIEFNYNGYCTGSNGTLYFGGIDGVTVVDPEAIQIHEKPPPVQLTSFTVFDREWPSEVAPFALDTVVLSYEQNFFTFEFIALDFTSPSDNQYAYRLVGVDAQWVDAGNRRVARYTDVDPGEYRFLVKGSNHDRVWNERGIELVVIITPPFWATWWFQTLLGLVLLSGLVVAYRLRVAQLLRLERMRLRIASDLHDEIGSNLGSIALMADLTRHRLGDASKEANQIGQISKVARATAGSLRDIVWIVNPEHDRIENLMLKLREISTTSLAGFDVRFSMTEKPGELHLPMEFRRQAILAFKEMLTNVARHSGATSVAISSVWEGPKLCIRVSDNGNGFQPETGHSGTGLASLHRRASLLRGSFHIETKAGQGTTATFCARIP